MEKEYLIEEFSHTKEITKQIPQSINFGYCPIGVKTYKYFKMHNYGEHPVSFTFETSFFVFNPNEGIIQPQKSLIICVSCSIDEARTLVGKAILRVQYEDSIIIKLSAIFKYPFLRLEHNEINFESVLVGQSKTVKLELFNPAEVPAKFVIKHVKSDDFEDTAISLDVLEGVVPSGLAMVLNFTYSPKIVNFISSSIYNLEVIGGLSSEIVLRGQALKISALLEKSMLNFKNVKVGNKITLETILKNLAKRPLKYFILNYGQPFEIDSDFGTIPDLSYAKLKISFKPQSPGAYFQRVFILIKDQDILNLELFGTCSNLLLKPPIIPMDESLAIHESTNNNSFGSTVELQASILKNKPGIYLIKNQNSQKSSWPKKALTSFKQFEKEIDSNLNKQKQKLINQVNENTNNVNSLKSTNLKSMEIINSNLITCSNENLQNINNHDDRFKYIIDEEEIKSEYFKFSQRFIDFGSLDIKSSKLIEVLVHNNHEFYTLNFILFLESQSFEISHSQFTLAPKTSSSLIITFHPKLICRLFNEKVLVYVSSESPRQTNKPFQCNNLVLLDFNLQLFGSSFILSNQPFIPMILLEPSELIQFPPTNLFESNFQILTITNKTSTPTHFKIGKPQKESPFEVFPLIGVIPSLSSIPLIFKFNPKYENIFEEKIQIKFNAGLKRIIIVKGFCMQAELQIEEGNAIFFPPCSIGFSLKRQLSIKNNGRMSLNGKFEVPSMFKKELIIEPSEFNINQSERIFVNAVFTPQKNTSYHIKCLMNTFNSTNLKKTKTQTIMMIGEGQEGKIVFDSEIIDFGVVLVNFTERKKISIQNLSDSSMQIKLIVLKKEENLNDFDFTQFENTDLDYKEQMIERELKTIDFLSLDFVEGVISAKSSKEIWLTFKPAEICDNEFSLIAIAIPSNLNGELDKQEVKQMINTIIKSEILVNSTKSLKENVDVEDTPVSNETINRYSSFAKSTIIGKMNPKISNMGQLKLSHEETNILKKAKSLGFVIKSNCTILLRANYPLLRVIDIRNADLSFASLCKKFEISEINNELIKKLKKSELQGDFSDSTEFKWDFGYLHNCQQGNQPRLISLEFQNIGGTELEWRFKEDEGGFSDDEDINEGNKKIGISSLTKKLFEIKPKHGNLAPQQRQVINLSYYPTIDEESYGKDGERRTEEEHFLSGQLFIRNGKTLRIKLTGKTLSSLQGKVALKSSELTFPKIPLGLKIPVAIPLFLFNIGNHSLKYCLDLNRFKDQYPDLIKDSVIEFRNYEGILPGNEKKVLSILYCPITQVEQKVELIIKVNDYFKEIQTLCLVINLPYTETADPEMFFQIDNQLELYRPSPLSSNTNIYLSEDIVDFKSISLDTIHKRIIFFYNPSDLISMEFKFNTTTGLGFNDINVSPQKGIIEPKKCCMITLSLDQNDYPSFWEGELSCKVIWRCFNEERIINSGNTSQNKSSETIFIRIKKYTELKNLSNPIREELSLIPTIFNSNNRREESDQKDIFGFVFKEFFNSVFEEKCLESVSNLLDNRKCEYILEYSIKEIATSDISENSLFINNVIEEYLNEKEQNNYKDISNKFESDLKKCELEKMILSCFEQRFEDSLLENIDSLIHNKNINTNKELNLYKELLNITDKRKKLNENVTLSNEYGAMKKLFGRIIK